MSRVALLHHGQIDHPADGAEHEAEGGADKRAPETAARQERAGERAHGQTGRGGDQQHQRKVERGEDDADIGHQRPGRPVLPLVRPLRFWSIGSS